MHDRGVAWASEHWGRPVADIRPLRGGWTSTMLQLVDEGGDAVVLRLMTREPWRRHAAGLLARESKVQDLLAATPLPVPTSLAVDLSGDEAGVPAHLMSRLPGRLELRRHDDQILQALARLLRDVHAVDPGEERPRDYQSWAPPAKRVVPAWSRRPDLWRTAFDVLAGPPPPYAPCFLHRDFHLGNVLWQGDAVSGLVDWVETSWGPAELDIAHAATYLALLHGGDVPERFVTACLPEPLEPGRGYWHVLDVVGHLPDPVKVVAPWRDQGIAITDELARARLELWLDRVLRIVR